MAGLLLGVALPGGLGGLPLPTLKKGLLQHEQQPLGGRTASAFVVAAACDGLAPPTELVAAAGGAAATRAAVSNPPRVSNHTRRLTVPTYCLGTRTRTRRRSRRALGGDDEFDGGDGGNFWGGGGDDGGSGGDPWWGADGGDEEEAGGLAARLQDMLLLWSVFCALAFCQVCSGWEKWGVAGEASQAGWRGTSLEPGVAGRAPWGSAGVVQGTTAPLPPFLLACADRLPRQPQAQGSGPRLCRAQLHWGQGAADAERSPWRRHHRGQLTSCHMHTTRTVRRVRPADLSPLCSSLSLRRYDDAVHPALCFSVTHLPHLTPPTPPRLYTSTHLLA